MFLDSHLQSHCIWIIIVWSDQNLFFPHKHGLVQSASKDVSNC